MGSFLPIVGSIAGGLLQGGAAKKAANQQAASAAQDLAFQKETRDLIFDRYQPFYESGVGAQNALAFELGLGNRPTIGGNAPSIETFTNTTPGTPAANGFPNPGEHRQLGGRPGDQGYYSGTPGTAPTTTTGYRIGTNTFASMEEAQAYANANKTGGTAYRGFKQTPGYQFQLDQGNASVNALAGAKGGLNSGATMQALSQFNQGLANQEYGNYLSRLMSMAGTGAGAAGGMAGAAQSSASGVSNALAGIGNAQSAGSIGFGNGIASGINNGISAWQYQKAMQPQAAGGGGLNYSYGGGR